MALRYCFETSNVRQTLNVSKKSDLAVIDSEGLPKSVIQSAVNRGVFIYDYLNVGDAFVMVRQEKKKYHRRRL